MSTVLIFDLDETIFQTLLSQNARSHLSRSAENSLSNSTDGTCEGVQITENEQAYKIQAIARKEMKEIFDKIYQVIIDSKNHQMSSPIAVKIITAGLYEEEIVKKIFDQFFSEGDNRFSTNEFPVEYFRRNKYLANLNKAQVILNNFDKWEKSMPTKLNKDRVILIDNAEFNTIAVEEAGFSVLHYPTTIYERPPGTKYSEESPKIFKKLHSIIDEANLSLQERIKEKNRKI